MKAITLFLIGIILNLDSSARGSIGLYSKFQTDSLPDKILIINSFDATLMKVRKNKKELFAELADSLKQLLYDKVEPQYQSQAIIFPGLLKDAENPDSAVLSVMAGENASMAIVIKDLDVRFEQTGVEVTGEKNDKTRTASYDICSMVTYALYNSETKIKESKIDLCEFYTTRNVISGLLAAGPDVVHKRKDVFNMVAKNAAKLFLSPGVPLFYQNNRTLVRKTKSADTLLKYSLSFADQAQMSYDGTKLRTYINQPFVESGDVAYYRGKYFNARSRYAFAFTELQRPESVNDSTFFDLIIHDADTGKLNKEYIRILTRTVSTVGMLYQTRGKFVQAESLLTEAMEMRAHWFGKNSPEYFNSLHNIAVLKKDMGIYDEAETIYNYLVPIFEKLFTRNSLEYVVLLNNKAMLLAELGRAKEAIELLDEALKIGETVLSSSYIDYERILTNRALLEQESGILDKAEEDYLKVMANMEKKGFDDHPDYNNVMVYYGSLRVQKNDPDVLNFLLKVSDKVKRRYGENHPLMAKALTNIGEYYLNKKLYEDARNIYSQIASIQLKELGERHKDYLNTLMKMAVCEWFLHDNENAAVHFNKAIQNYLLLVNTMFHSMSESEKSNFWRTLKPDIDTYFAFVIEAGHSYPALLKDAYNLQLKTKGILINSTKQTKNIILNSKDSVTRTLYNEWQKLKSTLSIYYSSPLEDLKDDKIDLTTLEKQVNEAEKELSRRSGRFSKEYNQPDISFDDVRNKLNTDEVAVEIIQVFHYYGDRKGESEYIALVVKKDSLNPTLIRIGKGSDLEKDFLSLYKSFIKNKIDDTISYTNYWQPLEPIIRKHKTVYVSVDGVYNSINLNTLQRSDGTFILDNYNIVLVPNTSSIVIGLKSALQVSAGASEALLLGSPNYGNDNLVPPLPGTKEEVQRIDTILLRDHLKTKIFMGETASEQNIKAANHPVVLHVATHGFFNANVDLSKSMSMGVEVSRARNNPLLRSGLLFKGAASVYSNEPILDGSNNGVLYAYEAMNLNLEGTRLVVLSACETGLGEIVNGEGVYGLSRSFQVAGASKILMSLWKVDDQVTRQLMIAFYENWLGLNDPQQALLQAEKIIKEKYPSPYYWGAFILLN